MNTKKIITLVGAVALVGALGVGSSLAYFTDKEDISNTITMKNVNIKLFENTVIKDNEDEYSVSTPITEDGLVFSDVIAGQELPKNPTVEVESGSADCFVRVKMDIKAAEGSTITNADLKNLNDQIVINDGWTLNSDGYYYFGEELEAGDAETLFDEITIPTSWKNNTANQQFTISLQAQAVQSDYLDDGVVSLSSENKVIGWSLTTEDIQKLN